MSFHQCGGNVGDTVNFPLPVALRGCFVKGFGSGVVFGEGEGPWLALQEPLGRDGLLTAFDMDDKWNDVIL